MKVIGLTGPIGAGKTTIAKAILSHVDGALFSFADPIKLMFEALVRVADPLNSAPTLLARDGKDTRPDWLQGKTVRHALQTLGTEWGRDQISPHFWTELAKLRALQSDADVVVFDDVRFWTEADMITDDLGGIIVELTREGTDYPKGHRSEGQLANMFDKVENVVKPSVTAEKILRMIK